MSIKYINDHKGIIKYDSVTNRIEIIQPNEQNEVFSDDTTILPIEIGFSPTEIARLAESHVEALTLSVTENCNYRCGYCIYDHKYQNGYCKTNMDLSTALSAIDLYFSHSKDNCVKSIGFYGGEPLLNFKLIKKCVEHIESLLFGEIVNYSITTNGMLLHDNNIRSFLIDKSFDILVSLDGPAAIHDKYRRTVLNNDTHTTIIRALRAIHSCAPEYFEQHVAINAVVWDTRAQNLLASYFNSFPNSIQFSPLYATTRFASLLQRDLEKINSYAVPVCLSQNHKQSNRMLARKLRYIHEALKLPAVYDKIVMSNTCIPGVRKLFVATRGDIYICEKTNDNDLRYVIGNVTTGIQIERIQALIDNFICAINAQCGQCWAIRFCRVCYAHIDSKGTIQSNFCNETKTRVESDLCEYVRLFNNCTDVDKLFTDNDEVEI